MISRSSMWYTATTNKTWEDFWNLKFDCVKNEEMTWGYQKTVEEVLTLGFIEKME